MELVDARNESSISTENQKSRYDDMGGEAEISGVAVTDMEERVHVLLRAWEQAGQQLQGPYKLIVGSASCI